MMGLELVFFILTQNSPAATTSEEVERKVIYQEQTTLDFEESEVVGEKQAPPTFFVTKKQTPDAESLLSERLNFKMKDYNELGF